MLLTNIPKPFFDESVTNAVELITAGQIAVTNVSVDNTAAAKTYIQLFDAATAAEVTLGTTVPAYVVPVAPSLPFSIEFANGLMFKAGVCYAATNTVDGAVAPASVAAVSVAYSVE
jgi:hypothetical protein